MSREPLSNCGNLDDSVVNPIYNRDKRQQARKVQKALLNPSAHDQLPEYGPGIQLPHATWRPIGPPHRNRPAQCTLKCHSDPLAPQDR
jgi:hypothetical protein